MLSKLMASEKLFYTLLFFCFAFAIFLRIYKFIPKNDYHFDEAGSYIAATNNWSNYLNIHDMLAVTGKELRDKLLNIPSDQRGNYKKLMRDTGKYDDHPPLYFIILHTLIWWMGGESSKWHGFILNISLFTATFFLFIRLSKNLLKTKYSALTCVFLWSVSQGPILNTLLDRMYEMMTLFVLLALLSVFSAFDKDEPVSKDYILYSIILIYGFLTHYTFLLFTLFLSLVILFNYRNKLNVVLCYFIATISSFIISNLIFPFVLYVFINKPWQMRHLVTRTLNWDIMDLLGNYFWKLSYTILQIGQLTLYKKFSVFLLFTLLVFTLIYKNVKKEKIKIDLKGLYIFLLVILFTLSSVYVSKLRAPRIIYPMLPLIFILITQSFEYIHFRVIRNLAIIVVGIPIMWGSFYNLTVYSPQAEAYKKSNFPTFLISFNRPSPLRKFFNKGFIRDDKIYRIYHIKYPCNIGKINDIYNDSISKFENILVFLSARSPVDTLTRDHNQNDTRTYDHFQKLIQSKYKIIGKIEKFGVSNVYELIKKPEGISESSLSFR
jgi:hypothetical protein